MRLAHPKTQALEEVHVGLRALGLLAHEQQQRPASAWWHHRVAAHYGAQCVRLQLLLRDGTAGKLRPRTEDTTTWGLLVQAGTAQGKPAITTLFNR